MVTSSEKSGSVPLAARIAMGLFQYHRGRTGLEESVEQKRQAHEMNQELQQLELASMAQASQGHYRAPIFVSPVSGGLGFDSSMPPGMDEGMVRLASAAGQDMAHFEKEGAGFLDAMKGVGRGLMGAGKSIGSAALSSAKGIGGAVKSSLGNMAPKPASPLPSIAPPSSAMKSSISPVKPPSAPTAQVQPPPVQTPSPATAGAPSTLQRLGSELGGGQWKTKLPMLAAAGLGTYGAVKGLKAGLNYLSRESTPYSFNQGGPQLAHGVNEYGYPQVGV